MGEKVNNSELSWSGFDWMRTEYVLEGNSVTHAGPEFASSAGGHEGREKSTEKADSVKPGVEVVEEDVTKDRIPLASV